MKKFLNLIILTFILTQSSFAQKYNTELISKNLELNFATTPKRGIDYNDVIYYVEKDLQTISAYKNNKIIWQTNVISVCGKPKVGKPEIRYMALNKNKLLVVIGKHNFAEVDIKNGKTKLVGSDQKKQYLMKIIAWNCNMAFRKKAEFILPFNPDIAVISECESPEKLKFPNDIKIPSDILWYGTNPHKGLGVLSYSDYRFQLLDFHNPTFKNILPIAVTGGKIDFTLFAVWANNPADKDGAYVTQVWKAINYYEDLISESKTVLIGDFNSNTIWDKPRREGNHTTVVNKLAEKNIFSTYHKYYNQTQGKEEHPTLYMYRHENKPYHLDYCFASNDFIDALESVEIGTYQDWTMYSDHKPLIIKFNI